MTRTLPEPSRERAAKREIGTTDVSPAVALGLALFLLLTITAVPAVELARGGIDLDGPAAGGTVLARMKLLENALEEDAWLGALLRPAAQALLLRLGAGNEQVYVGRRGWLYYRPDVDYATGPGFLEPEVQARRARSGDAWEPAPHPDPLAALLPFGARLAARGIALVVVPAPVKPAIEPDQMSRRAVAGEALHNPSFAKLVQALAAAGIQVLDLGSALRAAALASDSPLYLARDTHWTPAGMDLAAERLAALLRPLLPPSPEVAYRRMPVAVEGAGDLAAMLDLPAGRPLPSQRVMAQRVVGPDGEPWAPDPAADVLLLGDSFTNVYSQVELGWGEGAGLAEQLAFHLRRPVDRLAVNAGGAFAAREALARAAAAGRDRLAGKRVVVYEFAERELASGDWKPLATEPAPAAGPAAKAAAPAFVVWESNRGGSWRIWWRRLQGGGERGGGAERRLSREEPGRQHCCAHVSPDGTGVLYLSRDVPAHTYPEQEVAGELRWIPLDGGAERTLVESARTYGWGHRAAVWRHAGEFVYVGGDGRSYLYDMATGGARPLTREPRRELGFLVDPALRWAVSAAPNFSPYLAAERRVAEREPNPGCEPYFSPDGRWGFWVARGGGPIQRLRLGRERPEIWIERDDPRLPAAQRYVYFPMVSRDGRWLAWGASAGEREHDHFRFDYDVFVAPIDPATLDLAGPPLRVTDDPATDRYPDVFGRPLALGRHAGEAPLAVDLPAPGLGGEVEWDWGDGERGRGPRGRHTFARPGSYVVVARHEGRELRGEVEVEAAAAPRPLAAALAPDGRTLEARFDRPIRSRGLKVRLESGVAVVSWQVTEEGRALAVVLGAGAQAGDRLLLEGLTGASGLAAGPAALLVEPPPWPSDRRDLLFAFQAAGRPNLAFDRQARLERAYPLAAEGRARLDRDGSLVLEGGSFAAPREAAQNVLAGAAASGALTLEARITPAPAGGDGALLPILAFSAGAPERNVLLGQRGDRLVLLLRAGPRAESPQPREVDLFAVAAGRAVHLVASYARGELTVYRDGQPVASDARIAGRFGAWRLAPLAFGREEGGTPAWRGRLAGVALYARILPAEEALANARRSASWSAFLARPAAAGGHRQTGAVERLEVVARLRARSRVPTLRDIAPYRQALVVSEYEVEETLAGNPPGRRLRVAQWAILGGERQPIAEAPIGARLRLALEPFTAHPRLEEHYLADTLETAEGGGALYFAVEETTKVAPRRDGSASTNR